MVPDILDWATSSNECSFGSDAQRLAFASASFILNRDRIYGTCDSLSPDEFADLVKGTAKYLADKKAEFNLVNWWEQEHFNQGLGFFLQSLGMFKKYGENLEPLRNCSFGFFKKHRQLELFSLFRKEGIETTLLNGRYIDNGTYIDIVPVILGHCCASYDDEKLSEKVLENCLERAKDNPKKRHEIGASFKKGYENTDKSKKSLDNCIDEESYLKYEGVDDKTDNNDIETVIRNPGKREPALAAWDFREEKVHIEGSACAELKAKFKKYKEAIYSTGENRSRLVFFKPNRSEITLKFSINKKKDCECLLLYLDHCIGYRVYFPFGGTVEIEILLDNVIQSRFKVYWNDFNVSEHRALDKTHFSFDLLKKGTHEITIRVVDSTTTYWLREAWLEEQEIVAEQPMGKRP